MTRSAHRAREVAAMNRLALVFLTFTSSWPSSLGQDGNGGGDWVGGIADQHGVRGNISADPLFCDPAGCGGMPVEAVSWGVLKALYR
jgi:hypothetical protein